MEEKWYPSEDYLKESNVSRFIEENSLVDLNHFIRSTYESPEWFWDKFFKMLRIRLRRNYDKVLDISKGLEWSTWFINSQFNIADFEEGSDIFIKWEGEGGERKRISYSEVLYNSKSVSSWLVKKGLLPGDRVAIYLPMIPELVFISLGVIRAGGIIVPLFSGFGSEPIRIRMQESDAKFLFTCDVSYRKGKEVDMLTEALKGKGEAEVVVIERSGKGKEFTQFNEVRKTAGDYLYVASSEDPFMIIYTSGTTGKPKGTVHVHGGFPIKASADIYFQFDLRKGETLMWVTDFGWMMGPWVVFGGLLLRNPIGMIEGAPDYPSWDRLFKFVEDEEIGVLGLSPTLIRALRSKNMEINYHPPRIFGSTGEPLDEKSWLWLFKEYGKRRVPIVNYSGGTEISGGILGCYVVKEIRPSSFNGQSPGINAEVFDENGKPVRDRVGELVVLSPWPGMTRGFWKSPERYLATYWSKWEKVWVHGDLAVRTSDGFFYIIGRADDTIKVSGKRIGPAEIEGVLNSHEKVIESACIGVPDEIKGEKVICFSVAKGVTGEELKRFSEEKLGRAISPSEVYIVSSLPKTRNAKIMRRLIRNAYLNLPLGDVSSLENAESLNEISRLRKTTG
jgi:acetyl-CoA synthetase